MSRLRNCGRDESGFVMVTVMVVLMIALMVAGVAISDTVTARQNTNFDTRADKAQHAADAGIQAALYRANEMNLSTASFNTGLSGLSQTLLCKVATFDVTGQVTGLVPLALTLQQGPCPTQSTNPGTLKWDYEPFGNRTSYATEFLPGGAGAAGSGHVKLAPVIVSIGRDDNGTPADKTDDVVRRVEAILTPVDPFSTIEATGNVAITSPVATTLNGNIRADGSVTVSGAALVGVNLLNGASLIEPSEVIGGTTPSLPLLSTATAVQQAGSVNRTAVSISPTKRDCYDGTGVQGAAGACPAAAVYSTATHKLTVASGSVTLAGGDYVFCGVSVASGASLLTSTNTASPTRIFIDSPSSARCTGIASSGNLALNGSLNTVTTTPSALQIYMAGSGTTATISPSLLTVTPAFLLYAPDTDVNFSFLTFQGFVVGHNVTLQPLCTVKIGALCVTLGTMVITQDLNLYNLPLSPSAGVFSQQQYVQCKGYEPSTATATADC